MCILSHIEYISPKDNKYTDNEYHKRIKQDTMDEEFTLKNFSPREDGLNNELMLKTFKCIPAFFTKIYNECLRKGYFRKQGNALPLFPSSKQGKNAVLKPINTAKLAY